MRDKEEIMKKYKKDGWYYDVIDVLTDIRNILTASRMDEICMQKHGKTRYEMDKLSTPK